MAAATITANAPNNARKKGEWNHLDEGFLVLAMGRLY